MFNSIVRVRERRKERIQQLRLLPRDGFPPYLNELHDPLDEPFGTPVSGRGPVPRKPEPPYTRILGIQTVLSALLVAVAYAVFQGGLPLPASWLHHAQDAMTRDYRFEEVAAWYESTFGAPPIDLPILSADKGNEVPVQSSRDLWVFPSDWKVVKSYHPETPRIVLDLGEDGRVSSMETGLVTFVGEKEGFGLTVIVTLSGHREVWYGNLSNTFVKVNDWINEGEGIGQAAVMKEQNRYLYLALRQKDTFIDPAEVIRFD